MFVCSFGGPDYARRCSRWIKSGVCFVTSVGIAELAMHSRTLLCRNSSAPVRDSTRSTWHAIEKSVIVTAAHSRLVVSMLCKA